MKLASVENIKNLEKHPNADLLDIAEVLGWQTVVKKDIHKILGGNFLRVLKLMNYTIH